MPVGGCAVQEAPEKLPEAKPAVEELPKS